MRAEAKPTAIDMTGGMCEPDDWRLPSVTRRKLRRVVGYLPRSAGLGIEIGRSAVLLQVVDIALISPVMGQNR